MEKQALAWNYDRPSAFHQTVTFIHYQFPVSGLMTYNNQKHEILYYKMLAKFVPGVGDVTPVWAPQGTDGRCDNFPGGVESTCMLNGTELTTVFMPLMHGREEQAWEGAALLKVSTKPAKPVSVKFGGSKEVYTHRSPVAYMTTDELDCTDVKMNLSDGKFLFTHPVHPMTVGVRTNGQIKLMEKADGPYGLATFPSGEGWLLMAFSEKEANTRKLLQLTPSVEEKKVTDYYEKLLANWFVKTPDADINEGFTHALLNMEYTWVKPWGWIEALHHWTTFWHMQHTSAADWAGQTDRSLDVLKYQLEKQFEDGAIPHINLSGTRRRDWGGTTQFFFQGLEHYYNMTGDLEFIKKYESGIDAAIAQVFREYDPVGTGLIGWKTQIGNQEDFEWTAGGGAAPTAESIFMMKTAARFKRAMGKGAEADAYERKAERSRQAIIDRLWQKDLGRPAWYEDRKGELRPDGAYHTFAFPVKYGLLDDEKAVTSINHMADRMSGPEGEVYLSNHFSHHAENTYATWGMQPGAAQQPFAAMGYAGVGRNNDAYKPLKFIAKRACNDFHRGAWPECANERRLAYFSPSAAVYAQGVIEAVFGASISIPDNFVKISPCIPDAWPSAEMKVSGLHMKYTRADNRYKLEITTELPLARKLSWKLAPFESVSVKADGKAVKTAVKPGAGWFELCADIQPAYTTVIEVDVKPLNLEIKLPAAICEGARAKLTLAGKSAKTARLIGVSDPCGVLSKFTTAAADEAEITVQTGLLKPYMCFGNIGLMNFARRTFFVEISAAGQEIKLPVTVTVTPRLAFGSKALEEGKFTLQAWNGSDAAIKETLLLKRGSDAMSMPLAIPAVTTVEIPVMLTPELLANIAPGDNIFTLEEPTGEKYDVTVDCGAGESATQAVAIDESMMIPLNEWQNMSDFHSHDHFMGDGSRTIANDVFKHDFVSDLLPGLKMKLKKGMMLPVSNRTPKAEIDMGGVTTDKIYAVVMAFTDNHDFLAKLAKVELDISEDEAYKQPVISRTLCYPGDLDAFYSNAATGFATYKGGRDRTGLPPMPDAAGDYPMAHPPVFTTPQYWARCRATENGKTVQSLLEIDLGRPRKISKLRLLPIEENCAIAVLGVSVRKLKKKK